MVIANLADYRNGGLGRGILLAVRQTKQLAGAFDGYYLSLEFFSSSVRFASAIRVTRRLRVLKSMADRRLDLRKPKHEVSLSINLILDSLRTDTRLKLARLRGLEGAATAAYFKAYFTAFAPALGATHRNCWLPKDPVKAVLSLSYACSFLLNQSCSTRHC